MQRIRYSIVLLMVICLIMTVAQFAGASDYFELLWEKHVSYPGGVGSKYLRNTYFSPDSKHVALTTVDTWYLHIYETETGELVWEKKEHTAEVRSARWSPDGSMIATSSYDGTVRIFNAENGDVLKVLELGAAAEWAVFSPDGKYLYTYHRDEVRKYDVSTWQVLVSKGAKAPTGNRVLDVSPDGTKLAVLLEEPVNPLTGAGGNPMIEIWDSNTFNNIASLSPRRLVRLRAVRWSPDGTKVVAAGDSGAVVYNVDKKELLAQIGMTGFLYGIDWSPDGKYIVGACNSDNVFLWDAGTYERLQAYPTGSTVMAVAWSPDGKYISATTSSEQYLRVFKWLK